MQMKFHSPCYKYAGNIICKTTRWRHSRTPQDDADFPSRFVGWNFACSISRSGDILLYSQLCALILVRPNAVDLQCSQ